MFIFYSILMTTVERKMNMKAFILLVVIAYVKASCGVVEWTGGTLEFPSEEVEAKYRANELYKPERSITSRAQIYNGEIYVAMPKYKRKSLITLAKVRPMFKGIETALIPYPNFAIQEERSCNGLQSVVDLFIDCGGRMWVLDIGVEDLLNNPTRRCPPKVVVFNLQHGKKMKSFDLSGLVVQASRLQFILAEITPDNKEFVYVIDAATASILVLSVTENKSYRVVLPKYIATRRRDILYAVLVKKNCGNNFLILTYLSGFRLFSIRTDYIRCGAAVGEIEDLGPKNGPIIILGTDGGSAMFYRYKNKKDIFRWDSNLGQFSEGDLIYTSPKCYLATQVMPDVKRSRMRVLESNFPDFLQDTVGCGVSQRVAFMDDEP